MDYSNLSEEERKARIEYQKKYNQANKDKVANYQKLYYQEKKQKIRARLNKKKQILTDVERQERLEKSRVYAQTWKSKLTEEEKEHYRMLQKKYREENREKMRNYRKTKKSHDIQGEVSKKHDRNYYTCYCGKLVGKANKLRHDESNGHIMYMEREKITCSFIDL